MKFQHNTELVLKERLICIAMNMLKSVPIAAHDKSVTTQAQSTNKTNKIMRILLITNSITKRLLTFV